MNRSRIKVRITGDLQPGLNSNIFKVEFINIGKLVPSRQEMIPTNSVHLVQEVVFRLSATFNSLAIDGRCDQNTFSHCMYIHRHFVSTSNMMLHAHAWLKLRCVPKTLSHSISCFAPCFTTCTVHRAFCPLFQCPLLLLLSPTQAQGYHVQIPAQIHEALEVTVLRIQNFAQLKAPKHVDFLTTEFAPMPLAPGLQKTSRPRMTRRPLLAECRVETTCLRPNVRTGPDPTLQKARHSKWN